MSKPIEEQMREARERVKLSPNEAVELLNITNVHLCNLERGHTAPSFQILTFMAQLYQVEFVVGGDG